MKNRKNSPVFKKKVMNRGNSEFLVSDYGITTAGWLGSKGVLLMSNCHSGTIRTLNDGLNQINGGKKFFTNC